MTSDTVRLSKETLMPMGAVFTLVVTVFAAYSYFESQFDNLGRRIERLEEREEDRWTRTQQELWVEKFKGANPSLKIPEVE